MRKLYITRKDSLAGCLQKLHIYISDFENSELDICDIPCRKIGEIKNGESVTLEIDNDSNRIFVIADKKSRNLCCDSIHIEKGNSDIKLTGKCKFNPGRLNAFNFDGEPDEMAKRYRENGNRNGSLLLAGIAIVTATVAVVLASLPIWG